LLQKALEEFLKDYLSDDGVVISDEKGDIIIGKEIKKPFSKSQLLLQLEKLELQKNPVKSGIDISNFDEKLDKLIDEFSEKLKNLIKDHYGKK
jgi:hypothetical protein